MKATVNRFGPARRATLNGREHLIVPITMIVPGVLKGSNGPLEYPSDVVSKSAKLWNNIPILLGHPSGSGRTPAVINKYGLGTVFNALFSGGKLVGEAWFDIANVKRLAPDALRRIERGDKLELSTGLSAAYHRDEMRVKNITPDHLAVFVNDEKGACSCQDGCGVNNYGIQTTWEELIAWDRGKREERRRFLANPLGLPEMKF